MNRMHDCDRDLRVKEDANVDTGIAVETILKG